MAAYAALNSVMGTIEQLLTSNLSCLQGHKQHLKLLYEKFGSLQESLENIDGEPTTDLQVKVKGVAYEAEDEVESLAKQFAEKNEVLPFESSERFGKFCQQATQEIDYVKAQLIKQKENKNLQAGNSSTDGSSSLRPHASILEDDMVGRTIERDRIINKLKRRSNKLEVISVVGMAGIGKSTLAKDIFQDTFIKQYFHIRKWITVSENCNFRKMLLDLLQDATAKKEELNKKTDGDLAGIFQNSLKVERYLIIVDDIWSKEAWNRMIHWFPDCENNSRLVLTSRDQPVADHATSPEDVIRMHLLEPDKSWDLFHQKVFAKRDYPVEFKEIGREVVKECKGLPLMITAVAGILSSKSTLDEWKKVAKNMSSLVNNDDYQRCLEVVDLSYNHLPSHMKACFLNFGVFPKAIEISVKKLIRLWVAKGLLKLKGVKEWEKVAAKVLLDLIGKNLVIIDKQSLDGNIKTCRIHDLFHDLCLREAERENLLYVTSDATISASGIQRNLPKDRRWVSIHSSGSVSYPSMRSADLTHSKAHSLYFMGSFFWFEMDLEPFLFKRLRVLDLEGMMVDLFHIFKGGLYRLRYLAVMTGDWSEILPISNLWNIQTLIFSPRPGISNNYISYQKEIWQMSQLRYLYARGISLCSPGLISGNEVERLVLGNLLTVSGLSPSCCTKEVIEGIKKVKKLAIRSTRHDFSKDPEWIDNLKYLDELEALSIADNNYPSRTCPFFRLTSQDSLPPSLKKLKLTTTHLPWEYMAIIGKLPNLEVLQLKKWAFEGNEWKVTEIFKNLKYFLLDQSYFQYWKSDSNDHFPNLEQLIIRDCSFLKEIPQEFNTSKTLELIEVHGCTRRVVDLFKGILDFQDLLGRDKLKVNDFNTF
ncbi:putative late blight resistance protein homolog R1A-10 [Nicotiana tomentosiformis]|uniref:putative late blight resistance protein homolog R1A-10 n=1 Tax=Nicotiana tomentosiformis TaxID=4098 RepID=UPI00051B6409|nr:putative late blight resistance protein homolog R1A-10 [Nicotiana tomentosiformis]XP_009612039.1 putative late blight resistance protein homolog R1A-10 [Nicotiana tomentosiformis]